MPNLLDGTWAYSLQGFMHALNYLKSASEQPRSLTVNRASHAVDKSFLKQGEVWEPVQAAKANLPAFPTFLPPPVPTASGPDGDTGYYPVSEMGYMTFNKLGEVSGQARLNVAGYGDATEHQSFKGAYQFYFALLGGFAVPKAVRMGVITIQLDNIKRAVWDYSFIVVSRDELHLATAGRQPRPGVLTGTMRRIIPTGFISRLLASLS